MSISVLADLTRYSQSSGPRDGVDMAIIAPPPPSHMDNGSVCLPASNISPRQLSYRFSVKEGLTLAELCKLRGLQAGLAPARRGILGGE